MKTIKFITSIILLLFFIYGVTALEIDDMIELSGAVNGRAGADFRKETHNIKRVLPKGTIGRIVEKVKFRRGRKGNKSNYGLKIAITNGKNKGKFYWVYYNYRRPMMKLSIEKNPTSMDFEKKQAADTADDEFDNEKESDNTDLNTDSGSTTVDEANSALLTKDQPALLANENEIGQSFLVPDLESIKKEIKLATNPPNEEYSENCRYGIERPAIKTPFNEATTTHETLMSNYIKIGGDPTAFKQALCFFNKNKSSTFKAAKGNSKSSGVSIKNERFITINDQNKNSTTNRLFILDLKTNEVSSYFVGHGHGNISAKDLPAIRSGLNREPYRKTTNFSNENGSNLTPRGFFITSKRESHTPGEGTPWTYILRFHGIQEGINDNSFRRTIYMHPFENTNNQMLSSNKDNSELELNKNDVQPMTKGCTGLPPQHASEIMSKIGGGSLYYTYTPSEKEAGDNYCGDVGLMYKNK